MRFKFFLTVVILSTLSYVFSFIPFLLPNAQQQFEIEVAKTRTKQGGSREDGIIKWPPTGKIVALSVTAPPYDNEESQVRSLLYQLYIPFSILAWKALGYSSFIIVCGNKYNWLSKGHYLNFVLQTAKQVDGGFANFHFVEPGQKIKQNFSQVKLAQTIRTYAALMEPVRNLSDHFLITSDIDLIPLHDIYSFTKNDSKCKIRTSISHRRIFSAYDQDKSMFIENISKQLINY